MKRKTIIAVIAAVLCWALLLCTLTVIIPRLPREVKEDLICNGMPDFYVRLLLGKPDGYLTSGTRDKPWYELEDGRRLCYVKDHICCDVRYGYEFTLQIYLIWVTELQVLPARNTQENNTNSLLISARDFQSCGKACTT